MLLTAIDVSGTAGGRRRRQSLRELDKASRPPAPSSASSAIKRPTATADVSHSAKAGLATGGVVTTVYAIIRAIPSFKQFQSVLRNRRNNLLLIGFLLAAFSIFIFYMSNIATFQSAMQMVIRYQKHGLPHLDLSRTGQKIFIQYNTVVYNYFIYETSNLVIYNPNSTAIAGSWCAQCYSHIEWLSITENQNDLTASTRKGDDPALIAGDLNFRRCPGVDYGSEWTANIGDIVYSQEKCEMWYNHFRHSYAVNAGIETDDAYPVEIQPSIELSRGLNVLATIATLLCAVIAAMVSTPATRDTIDCVYDTYSSRPRPGKRNRFINTICLIIATIEALRRTCSLEPSS
jgi:hypothetical protein